MRAKLFFGCMVGCIALIPLNVVGQSWQLMLGSTPEAVPDAKTAHTVAVAVANARYGERDIEWQKSFNVVRVKDYWQIDGTVPASRLRTYIGGCVTMRINAIDGRISYLGHGK